jgi:hypothetical protein
VIAKRQPGLKTALIQRLQRDGQWAEFLKLREFLKKEGVPEDRAWKVAAHKHPPLDGSPPEILVDPMFAEIAANWENGVYPVPSGPLEFEEYPSGATNFREPKVADTETDDTRKQWEKLAEEVGARSSDELAETRWVVANYLRPVSRIEPDDVPSAAALSILMWCKMNPNNFGDFLRTNHSKLLPDKKSLEYQNRFVDDGSEDISEVDEFLRSLETEEQAVAEETRTAI